MQAGLIDRDRSRVISNATLHLSDELAAEADKILADAAPDLRLADLQRKAARLEARLDPEGVARRKEEAKHDRRSSCAGRTPAPRPWPPELDPADALAGKASIDAEAVRLRNAGMPGTLAQIRAVILVDRIHQRSPWDRLAPPLPEPEPEPGADDDPGEPGGDRGPDDALDDPDALDDADALVDPDGPYPPDDADAGADDADDVEDDDEDARRIGEDADEEEDEGRPAGFDGPPPGSPLDQSGRKTPLPALINITIPAGTLLGWSNEPAEVGSWGLMDAETARALIEAASNHPRTRWCHTLTGPDGRAIAHACAHGTHPFTPTPPSPDGPNRDGPSPAMHGRDRPDHTDHPDPAGTNPAGPSRDGPSRDGPDNPDDPSGLDDSRLDRLADLLAELNATPEPIARDICTHDHREDRYIPSRKLKHLVRARTARCAAPGCGAQAITSEIDHTTPFPTGSTCECNLGPLCQRHHHAKHAPGWHLEQTRPGVMRWTTPSGRAYTTHPTQYDE